MALAVAAGLGALLTTVPALALAMKIAGSAYLLYLAWQIAHAGGLEAGDVARPLGLVEAATLPAHQPQGLDLRRSARSRPSGPPGSRSPPGASSSPSR